MNEHYGGSQKKTFSIVLSIATVAFVLGILVSPVVRNYIASRSLTDTQSIKSVITKSEQFSLLTQVWNILDTDFIEKTPTANEKLYGMIKGLVASYGDPYTEFFDPEGAKAFTEEVNGEFEGVGMEVDNKNGVLAVIAPLKDTPAYKAGIKAGDIIVKIDGETTSGLTIDEAVKKMRGKKGTEVVITIMRTTSAEPIDITITRDVILVPALEVKKINGVRVVSLYVFTEHSFDEFKEAIRDYNPVNEKGLIIDLRGNPGGYLDAANDIASLFLESGQVVVREVGKNEAETVVHRSKGVKTVFQNTKIPIVVLVDAGSASASEILAGAFSEHGIATLVGTQTYGKGSVQEAQKLPLGTAIKVTVAEWHTPDGVSISEEGLKPDVEIPFDVDLYKQKKVDNQLQKAIEIITSGK